MEEAFQGVAKRDECEWDWRRTRFQQWRQQIAALCHSSWELVPLYLSFYLFLHSFVFFCGLRWDYRLVLTKTLILLLLFFFCYLFIYFFFLKVNMLKEKLLVYIDTVHYLLQIWQITTYLPILLKFKLPTCNLRFDTLSTWG